MTVAGYVTFEVAGIPFAAVVEGVGEVVHATSVRLLPGGGRTLGGRELALLDVRGRAMAVLDLRRDPTDVADVLVPRTADRAGFVVDVVTAVLSPADVVAEDADLLALPSYALGVLRPVAGGTPMLLVELPEIALAGSGADAGEPALGEPVLDHLVTS